jgi:hypothetical protein
MWTVRVGKPTFVEIENQSVYNVVFSVLDYASFEASGPEALPPTSILRKDCTRMAPS